MSQEPEITPTLAELSLRYRIEPLNKTLSDEEHELLPEYLEEMARNNPVPAIRVALILDRVVGHSIFLDKVVAPYASDIPDEDLKLLREATAYIAGKAIWFWMDFPINEEMHSSDHTILQALGFLFRKLSRTEGQAEEVRELADSVWKSCAHHPDPEILAGIMPFTTKGARSSGDGLDSL